MKVLVTGCNGQLGHEMQAVLEQELPGQAVYTDIDDLDITDAVKLKDFVIRNDITHIVNCAAYTAVDRAEEDKAICTKINVEAVTAVILMSFSDRTSRIFNKKIKRTLSCFKAHQCSFSVIFTLTCKAVFTVQIAGVSNVKAKRFYNRVPFFEIKCHIFAGTGQVSPHIRHLSI